MTDIFTPENCKTIQERYRNDYTRFYYDCLGMPEEHIWAGMHKIADSVRDHQKTCVFSGHSLSKDYGCARLAIAYLYAHGPKCTVIVTGPANNQVENIFFREVRDAYNSAKVPLCGKLTTTKLEIDDKWFLLGFTTDEDSSGNATKFQGFHNSEVLVIFTEAAGIPHSIWRATEHLIISPKHRWLAYGNATSASGDFADCAKDGTWNHITLSVLESPNFLAGKEIIPGISGVEYERSMRLKYGADSDEYNVRIKGGISKKKTLGSYYGELMASLRNQGRVTQVSNDPTRLVHGVIDPGYTTALWLFQQRGTDVNLLSYYEDTGVGIDGYGQLLRELEKKYQYKYGTFFVPCDMDNNAHKVTRGETALDVLRGLGFDVQPLPREASVVNEGIPRTRIFLSRCWFDATNCEAGIKCLENYKERSNKKLSTDDRMVFTGVPEKDGYDHGADALRYASMVFEKKLIKTDNSYHFFEASKSANPYSDGKTALTRGLRRTA